MPGIMNDIEMRNLQNGHIQQSPAILVVGSTGTGKSSTIAKCTGLNNIRIGDGINPVTRCPSVYRSGDNLAWIDTQGWDEPDADDTETFQSMLQFLNRHDLTRLKAVIWTVPPGIRQDATLNKQANLINMFAEKEIWNNVIIICKAAMNPEHDAKGALQAGLAFNSLAKIQILGYRYLDDVSLDAKQRNRFEKQPKLREEWNICDDDAVRNNVRNSVKNVASDVQIIFKHYKCKACGVEGDHRLLPLYCHMEQEAVHQKSFIKTHPKGTERYHPTMNRIFKHPGILKKHILSGCMCTSPPEYYNCCKRNKGEEGCTEAWACCEKEVEKDYPPCQLRYQCCKADIESKVEGCETIYECCGKDLNSEGCQKVCKKCGIEWGKPANECYQKPHDLERVFVDL